MINLIATAIDFYQIILCVYALMSWFPSAEGTQLSRVVSQLCEPYLDVIRSVVPTLLRMDFSVIIGIVLLDFVKRGLYTVFS